MNTPSKSGPLLHVVQQHLAALILSGTQDSSTPESSALDALIAGPPRGSVGERLHIYAGGYPARLEEALHESFPAVAHVLGDGAFHGLVRRYIAAVPLRSYNLNDVGAELPRFLEADELTKDLPFLPDLARLEGHVARAFHAHDRLALETAANGRADVLVTLNRRDFQPAIDLFDVKVLSPAEALARLRRKS